MINVISYKVKTAIKYPHKAIDFTIYKIKNIFLWDYYYKKVKEPKQKKPITYNPQVIEKITQDLKNNDFSVKHIRIDTAEYKQYMNYAQYKNYPYYCNGGKSSIFVEKSLEHFLALKFLDLNSDDVYIDIANSNSPVPEIYKSLRDCKTYRQDLRFPLGVNGNVIGGDAGNLPLTDGFVTKMALHCSFEHFENDSDIRFIKEANRVLKRGGKVCILPLYLFDKYAIQTDPACALLDIEKDVVCYCARGYSNRHARFYDVPHLISRIRDNLGDLKLTIYIVQNEKDIDSACYIKFIGLFEKQ